MDTPGKEGTVKELAGQLGEEVLGKTKGRDKGEERDIPGGKTEMMGEDERVRARKGLEGGGLKRER